MDRRRWKREQTSRYRLWIKNKPVNPDGVRVSPFYLYVPKTSSRYLGIELIRLRRSLLNEEFIICKTEEERVDDR